MGTSSASPDDLEAFVRDSRSAIGEALVAVDRPRPRHVIVDPFQRTVWSDVGWELLGSAGAEADRQPADRVVVDRPAALVTAGLVADAAFVDGSHRFHEVFVDLYFLRKLVRPGGLVVLDDTGPRRWALRCATTSETWAGSRSPAPSPVARRTGAGPSGCPAPWPSRPSSCSIRSEDPLSGLTRAPEEGAHLLDLQHHRGGVRGDMHRLSPIERQERGKCLAVADVEQPGSRGNADIDRHAHHIGCGMSQIGRPVAFVKLPRRDAGPVAPHPLDGAAHEAASTGRIRADGRAGSWWTVVRVATSLTAVANGSPVP